jgi:hypothetical protein
MTFGAFSVAASYFNATAARRVSAGLCVIE